MGTEKAADRMQRELDRAFVTLRADLDRIELLSAAIVAFSSPVPEYEPSFLHVRKTRLGRHELGQPGQD